MNRDRRIDLRTTVEDYETFVKAARLKGTSLSAFLVTAGRALAIAGESGAGTVLVVDDREWLRIRLEINRIGLNLNQGVTALNRCAKVLREAREYGYWSEDEIRGVGLSMREAADGINALRSELTVLYKAVDKASGMPTVVAAKGRPRHARA